MDSIEPILPNHSLLPEVRAAERSKPVHRDGQRGSGAYDQHRRQAEEEAVEVDVEGIDAEEEDEDRVSAPALPQAHRIDLTADGDDMPLADWDEAPSGPRIDLTADGDDEPPAPRIDLSA